jgi:hypothetical protein
MSRSGASAAVAAFAAVGALAFAVACKSTTGNNCGNGGTPPSLVGSYDLLSYTVGTTTVTPPSATGNLRFHAATYGLDLSVPAGSGGTTTIADSGSYNVVGASCIEEFSVLGYPAFTGSFQLRTDSTFRVSGTASGQVAASLWKKTS